MAEPTLWTFLENYWRDHIIVLAISTLSGVVAHLHRRFGKGHPFSPTLFMVDTLLAGFAGLLAFWICYEVQTSPAIAAIVAGIAGHSAPRFIWLLEKRAYKAIGISDENSRRN
jgi:hypothetical protein